METLRPVEKFGARSLVSEAMLSDVDPAVVREHLLATLRRQAHRQGYEPLDDTGEVTFLHRTDLLVHMEEGDLPEGAALAVATIRVFKRP